MVVTTIIALFCAAAPDAGRAEFERAARYYKAQEYEAALPWFQKAYEASGHRPSTIRGLAQCERALKMYDEAIEHFREYLATNPPAGEAKSVRNTIAMLEDLQKERALARAEEKRAKPAPERAPREQPAIEQPAIDHTPPAVVDTTPPQPSLAPPITTHTNVEPDSTVLPWITIGAGAAVAVTGAALFAIGRGDVNRVESAPDGTPYRGEIEDAAGRAPTFTGLGLGMVIAGLTGTGLGVAWLIGQDDEEQLTTATSIRAGGK